MERRAFVLKKKKKKKQKKTEKKKVRVPGVKSSRPWAACMDGPRAMYRH